MTASKIPRPDGVETDEKKEEGKETKYFWLYIWSVCLFAISIITSSLPWSHWAYTINTCPGYNCECILFGKSFYDQFAGGETIFCKLTTLLQIPLFLTACFLSFYQGRRVLVIRRERNRIKGQKGDGEGNPLLLLKSRNGRVLKEGDVFVEEKEIEMEPPSRKLCITLVVISSVCLLLVTSIYILHVVGYHWSCNEYRRMLMHLLRASGNMAQILSERLECTAIFSFMDYLQPKRKLYDPYDYERTYRINTGMSLFIAQMALLKNVFVWICISYLNIKMLRKRIHYDRTQ
ncbi:hypothetical protein RUM44_004571 [Polyplax serrata]|uniref:Uncharacterized protein n=1 Tax=Polyplax serrata TaxID=468196 RepID=A0ABR1B375_POLSC